MTNPKISIVVIYGNSEDAISKFVADFEQQKFQDYEAVFVNSNSSQNAIEMLSTKVAQHDNWTMLTLPYNNDYEFAKIAGMDIVSGDYICFVDIKEQLYPDFIQNMYYNSIRKERIAVKTENNKLYKRNFIENHNEIDEIIKNKVQTEFQKFADMVKSKEKTVNDEIQDYYKNVDSIVEGKIYNTNTRCLSLQNQLYGTEKLLKEDIQKVLEQSKINMLENNKSIYESISKIYDYISSKNDERGMEINKLYEEITGNYKYTEKILDEATKNIYEELYFIKQKVENLHKEQDIIYQNLQRQIEDMRNEIHSKINAVELLSSDKDNSAIVNKVAELFEIEDKMNKNIDKIYSYINENNVGLYKELTKFYKEVDEKIKN